MRILRHKFALHRCLKNGLAQVSGFHALNS